MITIREFHNDEEAEKFWAEYEIPRQYKGHRIVGCELQYACQANNWAATKIVIYIRTGD